MENLILMGVIVIFIALTKAFISTIDSNLVVPPPQQEDRKYSEAEIAAKSMGYWESKLRKAEGPDQKAEFFGNIRAAQMALIYTTGDFVPEQAKQDLSELPKKPIAQAEEPLPKNVVPLSSAKKNRTDTDFFNDW